jgi:hypothetical protein
VLWLFLNRQTAGYHLHKVNAKLGIASRATGQLDLEDDGPADGQRPPHHELAGV